MLKKNKLLTGVVLPLVSMAIVLDPAWAMTMRPEAAIQRSAGDVVRVSVEVARQQLQQAQTSFAQAQSSGGDVAAAQTSVAAAETGLNFALSADATTSAVGESQPDILLAQEEPPVRKRKPEEEGQPQEQKREPAAERPVEKAAPEAPREEPAPKPERQREPAREAAPQERKQEPAAERPAQAAPEAPREEPAAKPERPRKPEREAAPKERNQQPAAERPVEAAPEAPKEEPAAKPERPRKAEREAAPTPPKEAPAVPEPAREAAPAAPKADAEPKPEPKPKPPRKGEPVKEEAVPAQKPEAPPVEPKAVPVPAESPAPEKAPVPSEQPNPAPGKQPADAAERPARDGKPRPPVAERPATPGKPAPPQDGATTGQAPAGEPVPDQVATPQQEAPSMTKEELDKAKKIASDPSKTDDTVILPVDKGAAVLDSDKEAERAGGTQTREERRKEREQAVDVKVPTSDAEAQATRPDGKRPPPPVKMEDARAEQGERIDRRPQFDRPEGVREWQPREGGRRDRGDDNRVILQFGDRVIVRGDDSDRFSRDGEEPYYERLPGGRVRQTIERGDGTQVVTIRNRYGDVIQRSRIDQRGREYVLFYAPELMGSPDREDVYRDPGLDLPPMRLRIPVRDYIIDTTSDPNRDYYEFLDQPPVEPVERVYSLDEVKYSARIRDKVRRIDLDTITFPTGSAEISMNQAKTLRQVADAINRILRDNPAETFLIEGHTDAVGSDESNLVLSDERAESVANVMTDVYGIPPENLATQGYGERYLKVSTLGPEQANRRVTIRRVTALVRPVASNN